MRTIQHITKNIYAFLCIVSAAYMLMKQPTAGSHILVKNLRSITKVLSKTGYQISKHILCKDGSVACQSSITAVCYD